MATRTSTQSGNFNSTSTWGGSAVPVDGDAFVVSAGHIVTINDDRRTTNGFHDSTVYGKLHITGSGKLGMNGTLSIANVNGTSMTSTDDYFTEGDSSTGPYFLMDNGALIEMKGNDADNHSIRMKNHYIMTFEINGTNPNPTTTTASNCAIGSTSLSFSSSTGFAAGDWFSVFRDISDIVDYEYDGNLYESFIVHDIDGNTVYPRQYVTPYSKVTRVNGDKLFVEDASVFRVGYKLIFGTGSNRNIRTVTAIGKNANRLTLNSAVSGTINAGECVYQTGTEKYHYSGDTVQKIATPITADAASGQNQIQVASTAGMAVGKRIVVEANDPADTNWDYENVYEISAISGNTITLTTNLANARKEKTETHCAGWVLIFDRDTVIKAKTIEADGLATTSEDRPYIYIEGNTNSNAYKRRFRMRNCLFDGIGSNTQNSTWYRGVMARGYFSYETSSNGLYASVIEGNVWRPNNRGNNSSFGTRDFHQGIIRNNVGVNGTRCLWKYSSGNNQSWHGNFASRATYACTQFEGFYEPYSEYAYNYNSRSDDYCMLLYHHRTASSNVMHNYFMLNEQRCWYDYYNAHNIIRRRNYFDYYRSWPYIGTGGDCIWLDCYFGNGWDVTGGVTSPVNGIQLQSDGNNRPDRMTFPQSMIAVNHNFKDGDTCQWQGYRYREWDDTENAWKNYQDTASSNESGLPQSVYVPAGATAFVAGEVKLSSGFSGAFPALVARHVSSHLYGRHYDGSTTSSQRSETIADSYWNGHFESIDFTSAAASGYERKTLTISPVNYDYYLTVYIRSNNTNMADGTEHWFEKPVEIYLNKGTGNKEKKFITHQQVRRGFNNSATRRVKRLGGRIK
tara:strand:- start:454 stop:3000 length:2547 start_codon:yes stop_codon:yes gene_type:complete